MHITYNINTTYIHITYALTICLIASCKIVGQGEYSPKEVFPLYLLTNNNNNNKNPFLFLKIYLSEVAYSEVVCFHDV